MGKIRWMEIIGVRLFSPGNKGGVYEIFREVSSGKCLISGKKISARLYVNSMVETDWSIYLYQSHLHGAPSKTPLGLNIAEAFCSLGLVNHSVWTMNLIRKEI